MNYKATQQADKPREEWFRRVSAAGQAMEKEEMAREITALVRKIEWMEQVLKEERKEMDDRLRELTLLKEREIEQIKSHWETKVSQLANCQNSTIIYNGGGLYEPSFVMPGKLLTGVHASDEDVLQLHTYSLSNSDCLVELETLKRENKELKEVLAATKLKYVKQESKSKKVDKETQTDDRSTFNDETPRQTGPRPTNYSSIMSGNDSQTVRLTQKGPRVLSIRHKMTFSMEVSRPSSLMSSAFNSNYHQDLSRLVPAGPIWQEADKTGLNFKVPSQDHDNSSSLVESLIRQLQKVTCELELVQQQTQLKQGSLTTECQELKELLQDCLIEKNNIKNHLLEVERNSSQKARSSRRTSNRDTITSTVGKRTRDNTTSEGTINQVAQKRRDLRDLIEKRSGFKESSYQRTLNTPSRSIHKNDCNFGYITCNNSLEKQKNSNSKKEKLAKSLACWLKDNKQHSKMPKSSYNDLNLSLNMANRDLNHLNSKQWMRHTSPSKY